MDSGTEAELKRIFEDIRERTGAAISLESFGEEETAFTFEYGGKKLTAYLKGTGETAEAGARLAGYLLSSGDLGGGGDRNTRLKSILLGEGGAWSAFRFLTKYNIPDRPCYAIDLLPERHLEEAVLHVERCLEGTGDLAVKMDDTRLAVVKFQEEGQSPYDFGVFLSQSLFEELGIKTNVGVGCEMKSFSEIATSYNQAVTAVRMSMTFHSEWEVHSYREYLLVRLLEDVPESRLKDYMEQFRITDAAEVFADEDMTGTAEAFLESSLNVSETSRNLFMHRNTLAYRLDKIERITGLNIRKFSDAVTFRVITILYKLLKH